MIRHPVSLHGVPVGPVPPLLRYDQDATTSCLPSRRTSFPSLGGTTVASSVRSTWLEVPKPRARGVSAIAGHPQVALHAVEKTGSPKFLRDPNHLFAHALRLRRNRPVTRQYRHGGMAPAKGTTKASTMELSKLNNMASRLAVYASRCGLPRHDARLASGCWLDSTAWDSHPQGLKERFQLLIHLRILLSQA
jgi:hypothetical protein